MSVRMNVQWNAKCFFLVLFFFFTFFQPNNLLFAGVALETTQVAVAMADDISRLISALIEVESGGDDGAVGDKELKHKSYGCLQIRQPCVDDVNRTQGTDYRSEDCLNNRELSVWICERYIVLYATEKRLGRNPTGEDRARIWNGGPNGYKKKSTENYWQKVKKQLLKPVRKQLQKELRIERVMDAIES